MSRVLVVLALLVGCKKATSTAPDPVLTPEEQALAKPLPVDPGVHHGTFDNGMKWFIEENSHPEKRVVFRLAVNAGSILEDPDQLGLAHFVEHMAFNGTESFPGNELISFLESTGTRFGPHLNAHTSFEETVYKLTVPTDDPKAYETAFKVVREWACCLTMDPAEMEKERGVVLEEWRTRLGPRSRITEATMPKDFFGSIYPDRLPIGTEESLKTFDPAAATRFYKDWYHPANMAIIVVGDVNTEEVLGRLEAEFGSIPAIKDARERVEFEIPSHDQTLFTVVADPEVARTSVTVMAKYDDPQKVTYGDYRETLLGSVAGIVLNERLAAIAQRPGAPFIGANAGAQRLTPTEGADRMGALAHEGRVEEALVAILKEHKRFTEHGVLPDELARAKAAVLEQYGRLLKEVENTDSTNHANEIVRHVLQQETMPGTEVEVEVATQQVPGFTIEEVNAWAKRFLPATSRVVTVIQPQKEGLDVPTEASLAARLAEVEGMTIAAPVAEAQIEALVAEVPETQPIVSEDLQYAETLGFKGLVLENGLKVWFKKTDFKADEVRFSSWREGGTGSLDDETYLKSDAATSIRGASGFADFSPTDLGRYLTGKNARVNPWIGAESAGISGSSSPDDLSTALQMVYLSFTAPRFTEEGLTLTKERMSASIANRLNNPNTHFSDAWNQLLWPDDVRRDPPTPETVEKFDVAASEALWHDRFSDPADFNFVFVGALPDDFEKLVQTWLGALPKGDASAERTDRGFSRKTGDLRKVVSKGIEAKSRFRMEYWGQLETLGFSERAEISALTDVLSVLLRERLREDLGGVYGVGVSSNTWDFPYLGYAIRIEFGCDPERVEELEKAALEVIASAKAEIAESYMQQEIAKNREAREEAERTNGFWQGGFYGALERGDDPNEILNHTERNEALTAVQISKAAGRLLDPANRATVILVPAK